jgi:CRP-like cAMP-binding protein
MAVSDAASLSLLHRLLDTADITDTVSVMEALKLGAEGVGALLAVSLLELFGIRGALVVTGLALPLVILAVSPRVRRADTSAAGRAGTVTLLHNVPELHSLDMASLELVASSVSHATVPARHDVVREGDPGDKFYVIEAGIADVIVGGYSVAHLQPGAGFGERALLRDAPRAATVRAIEPLTLLVLERDDFLSALTGEAASRTSGPEASTELDVHEALRRVGLFSQLTGAGLERLAGAATVEHWPQDSVVIREGDRGDSVYVVLAGRAGASVAGRRVATLLAGDSFGEIAVLHGVPRQATIVAEEALTTCMLPGADVLAVTGQPT